MYKNLTIIFGIGAFYAQQTNQLEICTAFVIAAFLSLFWDSHREDNNHKFYDLERDVFKSVDEIEKRLDNRIDSEVRHKK